MSSVSRKCRSGKGIVELKIGIILFSERGFNVIGF